MLKRLLLAAALLAGVAGAQVLQLPPGSGVPILNTIRSGTGPPSNLLGNNGDWYIDNQAYVLYGPKAGGAWPMPGVTMIGTPGNGGYTADRPAGTINGTNATFTLSFTPNPASSLLLARNGLIEQQGVGADYLLMGSTITFFSASIPQTGDQLQAWYEIGGTESGGGGLTTAGVGAFWYSGFAVGHIPDGSTLAGVSPTANNTPNQVVLWLIEIPNSFAIGKFSFTISTPDSGKTGDFAIYNYAGTSMLWHYGSGTGYSLASATTLSASNTQVVLSPGTYWFAATESGSAGQLIGTAFSSNLLPIANASTSRIAAAGNAATAGICPPTLGTTLAYSSNTSIPVGLWEP